jgi:hypothetical protein
MASRVYAWLTGDPPANDIVLYLDLTDASIGALLLAAGLLLLVSIITKRH